MKKFEYIKNDKNIIKLYNNIMDYEEQDINGIAYHNLDHVNNVTLLVEKILSDLKYDANFIEEAKIASVLHDVGCLEGKKGHANRSYEFAKKYLNENKIKLEYEDLVLEAIRIHSDGFDTNNIIALVLILCDKLDIKYTRITKRGYDIEGIRQLQYIKDIFVSIDSNILKISFIVNNEINKLELEEYYFITKVFRAIIAFSDKMNFIPQVLFNGEVWQAFLLVNTNNY